MRRILTVMACSIPSTASPSIASDALNLSADAICSLSEYQSIQIDFSEKCFNIHGSVFYETYVGNYADRSRIYSPLAYSNDDHDDIVTVARPSGENDWYSYIDSYVQLESLSGTDFGPARTYFKILSSEEYETVNGDLKLSEHEPFAIDSAYVAIGDQTVISAGIQDSILNTADDEPYDFWGTHHSNLIDDGVAFDNDGGGRYDTGEHAISIASRINDAFTISTAMEALDEGGSLVGVLTYKDNLNPLSGHVGVVAGDILDFASSNFGVHAGTSIEWNIFKGRIAIAANQNGWWNALATSEASLGLFTLGGTLDTTSENERGASSSLSAKLTDRITLRAGLRWVDTDLLLSDDEGMETRARIEYRANEALTLAAEVGQLHLGMKSPADEKSILDTKIEALWKPEDEAFEAALLGEVNSLGAYRGKLTASRSF